MDPLFSKSHEYQTVAWNLEWEFTLGLQLESLLDQKYRDTGEFEYVLNRNIKCSFYANPVVEMVNIFFWIIV